MKTTIVAFTLFCTIFFAYPVLSAESLPDGADLFIEAIRFHTGNHTLVHSLTYMAEQTYITPSRTEEEINKEADWIVESQRKAFEGLDVDLTSFEDHRDHLRKVYSKPHLSRLTVKYKASSFSRKLLSLQIERAGAKPGKWDMSTNIIETNIATNVSGEGSQSEGVQWFPQDRSAHINETQGYMKTLLNVGRLQGASVFYMLLLLFQDTDVEKYEFSEKNIAKFMVEREKLLKEGKVKPALTVGTVTYDGNAKAYVVETSKNGTVVERCWIDAVRGYVCPLLQFYNDKGTLLSEYKSENYFLHEKSGLWFPELYKEMTTNRDGKQEFKEYRIDKASLDINFPITDDEFMVEITEDATVTDSRKGKKSVRYMATSSGVLSLGKGGLNLQKMDWLVSMDVSANPPFRFTFVRLTLISLGIMLILCGLYNYFILNKKKK